MHLLFTPSEAPLSSILQNWKKLLIFHYCLAKGRTNFECVILILHTLNYHILHTYLSISSGPLQHIWSQNFYFCSLFYFDRLYISDFSICWFQHLIKPETHSTRWCMCASLTRYLAEKIRMQYPAWPTCESKQAEKMWQLDPPARINWHKWTRTRWDWRQEWFQAPQLACM